MATYSIEAKPAGPMLLIVLVVIAVGSILLSILVDRANAKRAAETAKQQEQERQRQQAERLAAQDKAKPIYRFIDSITKAAKRTDEPGARFLKADLMPCARIKHALGTPDTESTGMNGEFRTLSLEYRIDATRSASFECIYLSREPVISEILVDGQKITDVFCSGATS